MAGIGQYIRNQRNTLQITQDELAALDKQITAIRKKRLIT